MNLSALVFSLPYRINYIYTFCFFFLDMELNFLFCVQIQ